MIAAPMPMLWRRADCVAALSRIGTKALMTCARIGDDRSCSARHAGRGRDFHDPLCLRIRRALPEGFVLVRRSFRSDRVRRGRFVLHADRRDNPALHVAAITFDTTSDGIVPVARSHAELLAGGLPVLAESRLAPDSPYRVVAARGLLCRHRTDIGAVAALRRNASTCISRSMPPRLSAQLQEQPCDLAILPGSAGRAAGGSRALRAAATSEKHPRILARAGAASRSRAAWPMPRYRL